MRVDRHRTVLLALGVALSCGGGCKGWGMNEEIPIPPGIEEIRINAPQSHWKNAGFAEMVPPILLPTDGRDRARIEDWLFIPAGAKIDVITHTHTGEPTLKYPEGTIADRVEWWLLGEAKKPTVSDVRGGSIGAGGEQRFHVYRPEKSGAGVPLIGFEWAKADISAEAKAHETMGKKMWAGAGFIGKPKGEDRKKAIEGFVERGKCAGCHTPHLPPAARTSGIGRAAMRPTDSAGYYGPWSVLKNSAPLEHYKKRDRNFDREWIEVTCPENQKPMRKDLENGTRRWTCPEKKVPVATFKLSQALAAGDPHAKRVCESRRYLFDRMTPKAQKAFRGAFSECGIR